MHNTLLKNFIIMYTKHSLMSYCPLDLTSGYASLPKGGGNSTSPHLALQM